VLCLCHWFKDCILVASKTKAKEEHMAIHAEITRANAQYAATFSKGDLPMPPGRRFAVLTCMDARLDPAKFLGLDEGDAHVIRNAGGLASDDAIRSLVISHWLLGTQEAFVIAHTDCGMLTFTNDDLHDRLPPEGREVDFLPFGDLDESVRSSLRRIRKSPLLPDSYTAAGFVYDVGTGGLREVA
jgi:carbonic anhydrase